MEELGRRCAAAAPEVAVVVSPHSVHVEGHFAVVTAGRVGSRETDGALAAALLEAPLPILGVSYGGNDPAGAEFPLDWGTEVPLAFIGAPRVVVVAPARDRPLEEHLRLGEVIAALPGRVALIASADNGHAHDPDGPYGFDPAAAGLRRAATGDPRLGPSRLPTPRRARRAGEGRLALAAPCSPGCVGGDGSSGRARVRGADVLRDAGRRGSDRGVDAPLARHALERVRRRGPSNARPEPATRSLTVCETSTSPGPASEAIRAPVWTAMPRDLRRRRARTRRCGCPRGSRRRAPAAASPTAERAADGARRAVERGEEAVAGRVDLAAAKALELAPHRRVVGARAARASGGRRARQPARSSRRCR